MELNRAKLEKTCDRIEGVFNMWRVDDLNPTDSSCFLEAFGEVMCSVTDTLSKAEAIHGAVHTHVDTLTPYQYSMICKDFAASALSLRRAKESVNQIARVHQKTIRRFVKAYRAKVVYVQDEQLLDILQQPKAKTKPAVAPEVVTPPPTRQVTPIPLGPLGSCCEKLCESDVVEIVELD